jgi:hypothetical protein
VPYSIVKTPPKQAVADHLELVARMKILSPESSIDDAVSSPRRGMPVARPQRESGPELQVSLCRLRSAARVLEALDVFLLT